MLKSLYLWEKAGPLTAARINMLKKFALEQYPQIPKLYVGTVCGIAVKASRKNLHDCTAWESTACSHDLQLCIMPMCFTIGCSRHALLLGDGADGGGDATWEAVGTTRAPQEERAARPKGWASSAAEAQSGPCREGPKGALRETSTGERRHPHRQIFQHQRPHQLTWSGRPSLQLSSLQSMRPSWRPS